MIFATGSLSFATWFWSQSSFWLLFPWWWCWSASCAVAAVNQMARWPQWVSRRYYDTFLYLIISGTNYKSQVQDSFSISSSHHGSSDFTQATNVPKFNIHLPASLQPATFSPPPPLPQQPVPSTTAAATPPKDKHETEGEKITRRHTSVGQEKKKSQAKRSASQYQQRRRASYQQQQRRQQRQESAKKKHYSSTESDSESSYSEDGLWSPSHPRPTFSFLGHFSFLLKCNGAHVSIRFFVL